MKTVVAIFDIGKTNKKLLLFDQNFEEMDFTTKRKIIKIDYQEKVDFDVYLRKSDLDRAVYICTASKILKSNSSRAIVSSIVQYTIACGALLETATTEAILVPTCMWI